MCGGAGGWGRAGEVDGCCCFWTLVVIGLRHSGVIYLVNPNIEKCGSKHADTTSDDSFVAQSPEQLQSPEMQVQWEHIFWTCCVPMLLFGPRRQIYVLCCQGQRGLVLSNNLQAVCDAFTIHTQGIGVAHSSWEYNWSQCIKLYSAPSVMWFQLQ